MTLQERTIRLALYKGLPHLTYTVIFQCLSIKIILHLIFLWVVFILFKLRSKLFKLCKFSIRLSDDTRYKLESKGTFVLSVRTFSVWVTNTCKIKEEPNSYAGKSFLFTASVWRVYKEGTILISASGFWTLWHSVINAIKKLIWKTMCSKTQLNNH